MMMWSQKVFNAEDLSIQKKFEKNLSDYFLSLPTPVQKLLKVTFLPAKNYSQETQKLSAKEIPTIMNATYSGIIPIESFQDLIKGYLKSFNKTLEDGTPKANAIKPLNSRTIAAQGATEIILLIKISKPTTAPIAAPLAPSVNQSIPVSVFDKLKSLPQKTDPSFKLTMLVEGVTAIVKDHPEMAVEVIRHWMDGNDYSEIEIAAAPDRKVKNLYQFNRDLGTNISSVSDIETFIRSKEFKTLVFHYFKTAKAKFVDQKDLQSKLKNLNDDPIQKITFFSRRQFNIRRELFYTIYSNYR